MDVDTLIARFGGPSSFGAALGIKRGHASAMRRRRSIPSEYWPRLVAAAHARGIDGVSYEALARDAAARRGLLEAAPGDFIQTTPEAV